MSNELKKVGFEAPVCLVDAIQDARSAKRRYKDKIFSNRLAYEIGAKILLEIDDDEEEEVLDQRLADLEIQQSLINNQKRLLLDKKEKRNAEKKKKEVEILKGQQDIETLALKLNEYWEKITVFKQKECIGFILNSFPGRLTKGDVSAVFPDGSSQAPTHEEALQIATDLLRSGHDE
jgi:hypothetical protein